jgi:hypothetical protein
MNSLFVLSVTVKSLSTGFWYIIPKRIIILRIHNKKPPVSIYPVVLHGALKLIVIFPVDVPEISLIPSAINVSPDILL